MADQKLKGEAATKSDRYREHNHHDDDGNFSVGSSDRCACGDCMAEDGYDEKSIQKSALAKPAPRRLSAA